MAKYTPGPWSFGYRDSGYRRTRVIYSSDPSESIAVVSSDKYGNFNLEQQANANLIAASPQMYEALVRLRDEAQSFANEEAARNPNFKYQWGKEGSASLLIDAAIAKAQGKNNG